MTLDRQPALRGISITLRPLTQGDHDGLYQAAGDPLIRDPHPANRHELTEFDAFFTEALSSGGALVALSSAGRVVGASRYDGEDPTSSSVEIGWIFLERAHWVAKRIVR